MLRFFLQRAVFSLLTVSMVASLTFFGLRLLPGGPFDQEAQLAPQVQQNMILKYGLSRTLWHQYSIYMWGLLQGDLGFSYQYDGRPVGQILREALPASLTLGFVALFFAFGAGIPLGALAALKKGASWDRGLSFLAMAGVSVPSFLVGPLLILIFSFGWPWKSLSPTFYHWLESGGILLPSALWLSPAHWVLPILTLSLRPFAFILRLTRASVLEQMQDDFVRTAFAKGLKPSRVLFGHTMKCAVGPLLSYGGPLIAGLLSGSFVVEVIFAIPGLAKYFVQSVFYRDYPMVMGLTLVFSVLLTTGTFLMDVLYRWLDPRVEIS